MGADPFFAVDKLAKQQEKDAGTTTWHQLQQRGTLVDPAVSLHANEEDIRREWQDDIQSVLTTS